MSSDQNILEIKPGAGFQTWYMNFAPANALHPDFLKAMDGALTAAIEDPDVSVVVLTSGLKLFSAGGDAAWMKEIVEARGKQGLVEEFNATMDTFRALCIRMRKAPILFVAALNGHTLAGGLELAAACDLRFASSFERILIGVPEMDLFGAVPSGGGGGQFLARILGPAKALEFILEAKPISPQAALQFGLVERLYESGELIEKTEEFAASVAAKAGRTGVFAAKRQILGGVEMSFDDAMMLDRAVHWDNMRRGKFVPGIDDFIAQFGG
ncbi:enoyl-CoA hydratase/isomerase family protein [Actibacterium sp. D379-3]